MALARERPEVLLANGGSLRDMSDEQFLRWVALLEERTGMALPLERRSFLVTSVLLRMREAGFQDVDAYFRHVTSGLGGKVEWTALVDRLTVHETRFFRDPRALRLLQTAVFDELCQRPDWDGQLNIWSVGCATGEEAYTLAMVATQFLADRGIAGRFGVTGTDISLRALATAKTAEYPRRRARDIPESFAARYCEPLEGDRFRLSRALRQRVCLAQLNVLEAGQLPPRHMDLIYCQNLLIYFERSRREAIVNDLVSHLRPGGVLVLGAGEILHWSHPAMDRMRNAEDVLAFRRAGHSAIRVAAS